MCFSMLVNIKISVTVHFLKVHLSVRNCHKKTYFLSVYYYIICKLF